MTGKRGKGIAMVPDRHRFEGEVVRRGSVSTDPPLFRLTVMVYGRTPMFHHDQPGDGRLGTLWVDLRFESEGVNRYVVRLFFVIDGLEWVIFQRFQ